MKSKKLVFLGLFVFMALVLGSFAGYTRADNDKIISAKLGNSGHEGDNKSEAHMQGSTLEVHISDNGKVLVRGAKVTAVNGNVISASTTWGSAALNWQVTVPSNQVIRKLGGTGAISEVKVGDLLSFSGSVTTNSSSVFTVTATSVKDWSIQKQVVKTTMEGTLKTLPGATLPATFVLTAGGKDYTVTVASNTSVLNSSWLRAELSTMKAGDKIRVYGTVNSTNLTIDATVVRDTTLK
jgi:hypothetical protein